MCYVLLDTNFLIYLAKYKLFDELESMSYKLLVPRSVDFELEKIINDKKKKLKDREAASLAQQILKKWVELKKIKYIKLEGKNVDEELLKFAKNKKVIVATMDSALKKFLKKEGVKILVLRQKKYFVIE